MQEAIGGYFELELPHYEEYHKDALRLNSGKNCIEYILQCRNYTKVYVPYYTCEVVYKPFEKLGIAIVFYHINIHLEIAQEICLKPGEALLYTNYYGLKQRYVEKLAQQYGNRLIVDNSQAFYAKPLEGIDSFYTSRKFFGVPDGAYLYSDNGLYEELEQSISFDRFDHLLKRIDLSAEEGFNDYHKNEDLLEPQSIRKMSKLTQRIMQGINYEAVAQIRRDNYRMLHDNLGKENNLDLPLDDDAVPMVYPYLVPVKGLREKLIEYKIFVARYWPNVLEYTSKDDIDYLLAFQMQPLPIDQRYGKEEIQRIIDVIKSYSK